LIDLDYQDHNNKKIYFKLQNRRSKWFFIKPHSVDIGYAFNPAEKTHLAVVYDPSEEKKLLYTTPPANYNRFTNMKQLLIILIAQEVDTIKAFYKQVVGNIKYEETLEKKSFSESEIKPLLYTALDVNTHLLVYIFKRLEFALPTNFKTPTKCINELVSRYYLFQF